VSLVERDVDTSTLIFELQVRCRKHLARVMRVIRAMPDVLKVHRTTA
jgi:(p)ppGpp synthase/HD superfamily hydrolase